MKKVSRWAKTHKWKARAIIVIVKMLLIYIAGYVGIKLANIDITIPSQIFNLGVFILITVILIYPERNGKYLLNLNFYVRQKFCDFIAISSSFIMVCCLNNAKILPEVQNITPAVGSSYISPKGESPTAEEILNSLSHRKKNSLKAKEKRILKTEFKKQILIYGKAKMKGDEARAKAALPIILAILVAIGLTILLGSLACSISCGGADGAAIAVAVLGLIAIIVTLVLVIKGINKRAQRKVLEKNKAKETPQPAITEPTKQ